MKKREAERLERKAAVEQKKKERELAILAKKEEEEQRKIAEEEAEQRRFMELKMEERRLAKLAEDEKVKEKERRLQNMNQAIIHHKNSLLKSKGITPWKIYMACHRQDEQLAAQFRQKWDLLAGVLIWRRKLEEKRHQVEVQADLIYNKNLAKRKWQLLCQVRLF
ncbi:UNVERIFIED_CONTAM: hypothetical protein HDU68_007616 [Siphonaria sp. JEL0065]|nr:hypothetical protein HDU68_007616 [Siphonaria sp. JEL0065]